MAVETESFEPTDMKLSGTLARVCAGLRRRRNGDYVFTLFIEGEADLGDGRRARVHAFVPVPVTQVIGRRPPRKPAV